MKIFATLASLVSASAVFQRQGTRPDGTQWSAVRTPTSLAYQEAGESLVALAGGPVTGAGAKGLHTICYTQGAGTGNCKTEPIHYSLYQWDATTQTLTMTGVDGMGPFNQSGNVVNGTTVLTRTYNDGVNKGLVAEVTVYTVPDESGLFFGEFDFTTNAGTAGEGRMGQAFVENAQLSFDEGI